MRPSLVVSQLVKHGAEDVFVREKNIVLIVSSQPYIHLYAGADIQAEQIWSSWAERRREEQEREGGQTNF